MPRSGNHARLSQPTLFHPPHTLLSLQTFTFDIQEKTIRLLGRLLQLHADRVHASSQTREAGDE
jgi:hypothetical protein